MTPLKTIPKLLAFFLILGVGVSAFTDSLTIRANNLKEQDPELYTYLIDIDEHEQKEKSDTIKTQLQDLKESDPIAFNLIDRKELRNCYVTQHYEEHLGRGSMYAMDVHCGKIGTKAIRGVQGDVFFPLEKWEYVIEAIGTQGQLGDYVVIRHGNYKWVYGHTQTSRKVGDYIKVDPGNDVLGQENLTGVTQNYHAHIEKWECREGGSFSNNGCVNVGWGGERNNQSEKLLRQRGWYKGESCTFSDREIYPIEGEIVNLAYSLASKDYGHDYAMSFVGTIEWESWFQWDTYGDKDRSFGYCQIHDKYNYAMQQEYRNLSTRRDQITFCYNQFKNWYDRGVISTRLYGYKYWEKGIKRAKISCE